MRRWPGLKPRHSAWLLEAVRLDSEPWARVTAFVRHMVTPARQQQTEQTPQGSASSQMADDSYSMRLRNTTLDRSQREAPFGWILSRQRPPRNATRTDVARTAFRNPQTAWRNVKQQPHKFLLATFRHRFLLYCTEPIREAGVYVGRRHTCE